MHYLSFIYFVTTATCFGHKLSIIRRYTLYMYNNWYVVYIRLTGSWLGQDVKYTIYIS
jgi:hypothetical protein